jgi:hypothetical protein
MIYLFNASFFSVKELTSDGFLSLLFSGQGSEDYDIILINLRWRL